MAAVTSADLCPAPVKGGGTADPLQTTMSSREIAELTGKDLGHIHRDIRAMLQALSEGDAPVLDHVREVKDARGYTAEIHLPKDLTITLVSGYNVTMRHQPSDFLRLDTSCALIRELNETSWNSGEYVRAVADTPGKSRN